MVPEKLYKIGEVVRYSSFYRRVIHNYTQIGLIRSSLSAQRDKF